MQLYVFQPRPGRPISETTGENIELVRTVIEEDPDKSFLFTCGGVQFFFFPSRQPQPGDRFSEFRIGLDHLSFTAPDRETLDALAEKLLAADVPTKGVEQFVHTGNWYVAFRDPDNIQLEYWLP